MSPAQFNALTSGQKVRISSLKNVLTNPIGRVSFRMTNSTVLVNYFDNTGTPQQAVFYAEDLSMA